MTRNVPAERLKHFVNELEILTRLCHENFVTVNGCTSSCGLSAALAHPNEYLHTNRHSNSIDGDMKTNNILLDKNFRVKVADFGISRLFPNDVTHVSTAPQGTPGSADPEYPQCYQLTENGDVNSFSIVLVELLSSKPAVDLSRDNHEINLANFAINRIWRHLLDEVRPCTSILVRTRYAQYGYINGRVGFPVPATG
ncbi:hypothetical protein MLD38_017509 [Melastoma candidum]|uniref:Uncharacterized protein n=1 Tax=Melastoma candidum TaxID=119954 RepID=A0ACB9QQU6_9MYRT|nr:hypothetical protein MLD38_017509 [Melastoma candidum]